MADKPVTFVIHGGCVDGEKRVQQAEAARAAEADKWRHLTVPTVLEDGRFDSQLYVANSGIDSSGTVRLQRYSKMKGARL